MAIKKIGTLEAKSRLSAVLKDVEAGQRYYITRHGKPIAEVRPVATVRPTPRAGFAKGTFVQVAPDFDSSLDDFAPYMK